jgi:hypothetical protein
VRVSVRVRECVRACVHACVARRGSAVFMARPATRAPTRALVDSRVFAAGAVWRCRTMTAPWAGRYAHTSVIDAAGAIYVIGGLSARIGGNGYTYFTDVWASTDGGVHLTRAGGSGVLSNIGGTRGTWV